MIKSLIERIPLLTLMVFLSAKPGNAQVSQDNELFKILKARDSLMFEIGFNQCNLRQVEDLLPETFEFYHDKDGVITSREVFIKTLNENLCSSGQNKYKRILNEESVKVFPLYQQGQLYGAVQTGSHYFGNTVAKFTNLWLKENEEWFPTRIISYDHKLRADTDDTEIIFINLSSEELAFYVGKYRFSPEFVLSIIHEEGKIYGDAQGEKVEIKPYGNHMFLDESETMKLNFIVGDDGHVNGLEMDGPNGEMKAQKTK